MIKILQCCLVFFAFNVMSGQVFSEDFTGVSGVGNSFSLTGWNQTRDTDASFADGYSVDNGGAWAKDGFNNNGTADAVRINMTNNVKRDWLLAPSIDLSTTPSSGMYTVSWDMAFTPNNGSTFQALNDGDEIRLIVSTDNGSTYQSLALYDSATVIAAGGETFSVALDASYYSSDVQFAFWAYEGSVTTNATNVFVDNFMIKDELITPPTCTAPTYSITEIADCDNSAYSVEIVITDLGSATDLVISDGTSNENVDATGTYTFGPYMSGDTYTITITGDEEDCEISEEVSYTCIPNDECTDAISVTVNTGENCVSVTAGTFVGATYSGSGVGSCQTGTYVNANVWYKFEAISTSHIIAVDKTDGTGPNAIRYAIFSTSDNDCAGLDTDEISCGSTSSDVTLTGLTVGNTYYMSIYATGPTEVESTKTIEVCITTPAAPTPDNDECEDAEELIASDDHECIDLIEGTLEGATDSGIGSGVCTGSATDDVWYSFVASDVNQAISISNLSGASIVYYALYEGQDGCDNLVDPIGCGEATPTSDPDEFTTFTSLTEGDIYFIQVYSDETLATTFDICITVPESLSTTDLTISEGFSLYPNPTSGNLNVKDLEFSDVQLFTVIGRKVSVDYSGSTIYTSALAAGTYILQLTNEKGYTYTSKFIKK
ncbi:T9SS type A sorting domain-containing protein [Lacinutrix sp. C3R15]|uniref:T9SS type A sorting domain-containing protein n=1 Tax=Flavobacteriaceae TaxID=49546 RepID=UPI001C09EA78|nr:MULTISPECIES: T9SS type A sorting domain-containing protein [Flavobacteriaceae]MBU2937996.1 T9SS type A sorting domain-containing protein [Lacinutrix sp. C3R15]MDO6621310.1 T9SS type A sorting domain-containing protein [Oceanihabitans sp. 1_MG-2023]